MESQNKRIAKYLKSGRSLTPLDALYQFGCFRFGARVYDLRRRGMNIKAEMIEITSPSVYKGVKRVCRYSLMK
jgi:hypothetical protein